MIAETKEMSVGTNHLAVPFAGLPGRKSVSVIIPTYFRYQCLHDTLEGLCVQSVQPVEVIVADQTPLNERPDGFYDEFLHHMTLRVLDIETPSLSRPRNLAARKAEGEILLFLDDDIKFTETLIEAHLSVLDREHVDIVNGAVSTKASLPDRYPWDITALDPVRFFLSAPNFHWNGMAIGITSGNFSVKRTVFLASGGFDEKLPRMVDFDLGYRLFRKGCKIYFSDEPFVQHLRAPGGSRKSPGRLDRLVSALYIHKKHFPGWITIQFVLKVLFGSYFRRWTLYTPLKLFKGMAQLLIANRIVNKKLRTA